MTREKLNQVLDEVYGKIKDLNLQGSKEYAHTDEDVLSNFKRVGKRMGLNQKQILMVYLEKHMDGIHAYIKGHKSQREDVTGRISDALVYLFLLFAMIIEEREEETPLLSKR